MAAKRGGGRIKTVVYLDVLLLTNFLTAYLLLLAAGALSGQRAPFARMLAGSALAALSALILFAPEQPYPVQVAYKAATALGIAEAALAAAVQWMKDRHIAGEPIATKQGLQWMVADMKLRLEASWGLTLQALALRQAGQPFTLKSAMAKLHATEMVAFVADTALQIHGGYGYTREMPLERYVRDARILRIYEGSSEVQRNIIARLALG